MSRVWVTCRFFGSMTKVWNLLMAACVFYDLLVIPLYAFTLPRSVLWDVLDWLIQIYWNLDFAVSFLTGFYDEGRSGFGGSLRLLSVLRRIQRSKIDILRPWNDQRGWTSSLETYGRAPDFLSHAREHRRRPFERPFAHVCGGWNNSTSSVFSHLSHPAPPQK